MPPAPPTPAGRGTSARRGGTPTPTRAGRPTGAIVRSTGAAGAGMHEHETRLRVYQRRELGWTSAGRWGLSCMHEWGWGVDHAALSRPNLVALAIKSQAFSFPFLPRNLSTPQPIDPRRDRPWC